ncbi:toll-like receptor 4 [Pomacea canaliculata]|uniref:toll-like receptor 4 n=1 Tax=Pomacea canaliculata TaxID=400727 RepID=UPI000D73B849|nr:toll-like receptor 4 [Pomacea canaliculata]XP_025082332.1 toll-like receptor 4 [Pomacea canaliculata]
MAPHSVLALAGAGTVLLFVVCRLQCLGFMPHEEDNVAAPAPASANVCFPDSCRCWNDRRLEWSADCSQNNGSLTFVPILSEPNITFLNFSYNKVQVITDDFFANVTDLQYLELSNNNIINISFQAFKNLTKLEYLYLNFNYNLTFDILRPVFLIPTLIRLDVRHSSLTPPPDGYFKNYFSPSLETLFLHENEIGDIDLAVFNSFTSLRKLGLATNYISKVTTSSPTHLEILEIQTNGILRFPETCINGSNESLFPNLTELWLIENVMRWLPDKVCLPKLWQLQMNGNFFKHFVKDMLHPFTNLTSVYLNAMNTKPWGIDEFAFRSPILTNLSLAFNHLDFSRNTIHSGAFAGIPHLSFLSLYQNYFHYVDDNRFSELFSNLTNLNYINLGYCSVASISNKTFRGMTSLTTIVLSGNTLRFIPEGTFDDLPNLTSIDLSSNQLSLITEYTFSAALRGRLSNVSFAWNLFECTCDLLWFHQWLLSSKNIFRNGNYYQCYNVANTTVTEFYVDQQACLLSRDTLTIITVVSSMLIFTITLAVTLFRYRWHFRLLLYEAFRAGSNRRRRRLRRNFQYDVFVSYAEGDLSWVLTHLIPGLEDRMGLRVCLHQRDFIPGHNIVDNIADSVEGSQKMMMVFSQHFARSQWCQFELALCLSHVMDHDDDLLVVRLSDESTSRDMTAAMMAVLKTTTYIQWEDNVEARNSFWGRLTIALQDLNRPEYEASGSYTGVYR